MWRLKKWYSRIPDSVPAFYAAVPFISPVNVEGLHTCLSLKSSHSGKLYIDRTFPGVCVSGCDVQYINEHKSPISEESIFRNDFYVQLQSGFIENREHFKNKRSIAILFNIVHIQLTQNQCCISWTYTARKFNSIGNYFSLFIAKSHHCHVVSL